MSRMFPNHSFTFPPPACDSSVITSANKTSFGNAELWSEEDENSGTYVENTAIPKTPDSYITGPSSGFSAPFGRGLGSYWILDEHKILATKANIKLRDSTLFNRDGTAPENFAKVLENCGVYPTLSNDRAADQMMHYHRKKFDSRVLHFDVAMIDLSRYSNPKELEKLDMASLLGRPAWVFVHCGKKQTKYELAIKLFESWGVEDLEIISWEPSGNNWVHKKGAWEYKTIYETTKRGVFGLIGTSVGAFGANLYGGGTVGESRRTRNLTEIVKLLSEGQRRLHILGELLDERTGWVIFSRNIDTRFDTRRYLSLLQSHKTWLVTEDGEIDHKKMKCPPPMVCGIIRSLMKKTGNHSIIDFLDRPIFNPNGSTSHLAPWKNSEVGKSRKSFSSSIPSVGGIPEGTPDNFLAQMRKIPALYPNFDFDTLPKGLGIEIAEPDSLENNGSNSFSPKSISPPDDPLITFILKPEFHQWSLQWYNPNGENMTTNTSATEPRGCTNKEFLELVGFDEKEKDLASIYSPDRSQSHQSYKDICGRDTEDSGETIALMEVDRMIEKAYNSPNGEIAEEEQEEEEEEEEEEEKEEGPVLWTDYSTWEDTVTELCNNSECGKQHMDGDSGPDPIEVAKHRRIMGFVNDINRNREMILRQNTLARLKQEGVCHADVTLMPNAPVIENHPSVSMDSINEPVSSYSQRYYNQGPQQYKYQSYYSWSSPYNQFDTRQKSSLEFQTQEQTMALQNISYHAKHMLWYEAEKRSGIYKLWTHMAKPSVTSWTRGSDEDSYFESETVAQEQAQQAFQERPHQHSGDQSQQCLPASNGAAANHSDNAASKDSRGLNLTAAGKNKRKFCQNGEGQARPRVLTNKQIKFQHLPCQKTISAHEFAIIYGRDNKRTFDEFAASYRRENNRENHTFDGIQAHSVA